MEFTSKKTEGNHFTHQLQLNVVLDISNEIKVVCRSATRNDTSYEIFDQYGKSMGGRQFTYATSGCMNIPLVDDLNVLLEEFGVQLDHKDFSPISSSAARCCEGRYGNSVSDGSDGDVIITLQ